MNQQDKDFSKGYACACAVLMRLHRESTLVEHMLKENFMSIRQMRSAGVDEYDIDLLKPVVKEIERKRKVLCSP